MPSIRCNSRICLSASLSSAAAWKACDPVQHAKGYQALILAALQAIGMPYRIGSHDRDELRRAFASITSSTHANRPTGQTVRGTVKCPHHIVFYRVVNDDVIEVVRLLHDAMEVQLHLPND
nr:type II toxin-antitoxin system RelE/ParE family toxin [Pseudomonas sp. BF-R-19]